MQIKTIQKTIQAKLIEWLDTITDAKLRSDVKSNILVSGGSITSMLLNEPVNDYDVYIKDVNVLLSLVEYYTKSHPIQILKGWEKEKLMEGYNKGILQHEPDYKNQFIIAVNNLKDDQIKLFIESKGLLIVNENSTEEENLKYIPKCFSPNAISFSNKIQLVCRFHGDDIAIHKTFDFMHATNYFTFEKGLVTNKEALESIITKQLKYQGSLYPVTSIIRMKKFIKRGWNINAGEMLKIMLQISELDLSNADTLEEQLIGVDVAYFDQLVTILRSCKEEKLSPSYISTIIDKVFNEADSQD